MKKRYVESILSNEMGVTFYYCEDEYGNIVSAPNMKRGKKYKCPICSLPMHRQSNGDTIFCARYPGTHHLNPICQALESGRKLIRFPDNMTLEKFIEKFTREPMDKITGPGGPRGPINPRPYPPKEKETIFPTLKQFKELNIILCGENMVIGKYRLKDILLHFWWAQSYFAGRVHIDLGPRIVWCIFDFYLKGANEWKLIFRIFNYDKNAKEIVFQVKFCVTFLNEQAFRKQLQRVCRYKENPENGKMEQQPMLALIAGIDWKALSREKCLACCSKWKRDKCENCCGMFEIEFSSEKQIYAWENK